MYFSYLLVFFLLTFDSGCSQKSFVIVLDTTGSMRDEIAILKNSINSVASSIKSGGVQEYILVPFTDPDVGIPLTSSTPEGLMNFLRDVEVIGESGTDCPENSLAAIERALEISKNYSNIFLFTDASAKDNNKLRSVQTLCRQHQSRIITFLSGECSDESSDRLNVFHEVAKSCFGSVFYIDIRDMRHIKPFKYMKEMLNVDWTNINTHKEFMGSKEFNFDVDSYTKDIVVAVSGYYPEVRIRDAAGNNFDLDIILDTRRSLVIRLLRPSVGEYVAEIRSRGVALPTFYKRKELQFQYGFSPMKPRSLKETSAKPVPDSSSYLLVELHDSNIVLFTLEVHHGNNKEMFDIEMVDEEKGLYVVQLYFQADKPFQISVHGRVKTTLEVIKGITGSISPQKRETTSFWAEPIKPSVEIVDSTSTVVEFMTKVTLCCKVKGNPLPEIWWEDDTGSRLDSKNAVLEIPSLYISYATITNATTNTTIYCKCKNTAGNDSASMELFIHREFTFEVLQYPSDTSIEYGSEGKLYCEVSAYPEATLKWYHNDTEIEGFGNVELIPEDNALVIKNMNLEDTGEYKCVLQNDIEDRTYIAVVDITGLVAPSVEVTKSEYVLRPGDSMAAECKVVSGNPEPEVSWTKRLEDELDSFPEGVYIDGNLLKIPSATRKHEGLYKCEASNIQGKDSKEIEVKVYYPPTIKSGDEVRTVNDGEMVQLRCDVDAVPKATVHWDLYQGDVIIGLDHRHRTDQQHTHHFVAEPHDSGTYHCVAENSMGRAERTVVVNVLVAPFIEPLDFVTITKRAGTTLSVTCNVSQGHPVPLTRWQYITSTVTVLSRKVTSRLDLVLRNVTKKDEGIYQCVAENEVAPDDVRFVLKVQN